MNWFQLFKFSALHNFQYKLPTDPKQLLYDFYMSTFLDANNKSYRNDNLLHIAEETKSSLTKQLKDKLLDDVFFIICAEVRHAPDAMEVPSSAFGTGKKYNKNLFSLYKNYISLFRKGCTKHTNEVRRYGSPEAIKMLGDTKGATVSYDLSYRAAIEVINSKLGNKLDFVKMAEILFRNHHWRESFGGKAWDDICAAWLMLYNSKSQGSDQAYIDHIFDLEHNNGTMFDKLRSYQKENDAGSGTTWLKNALDHKSKVVSPYELLYFCSPPMQYIAKMALKETTGLTENSSAMDVVDYWKKLILKNLETPEFTTWAILSDIPDKIISMIDKPFKDSILDTLNKRIPFTDTAISNFSILSRLLRVEFKKYCANLIEDYFMDNFTAANLFSAALDHKLFDKQELIHIARTVFSKKKNLSLLNMDRPFKKLVEIRFFNQVELRELFSDEQWTGLLTSNIDMKGYDGQVIPGFFSQFLDKKPGSYFSMISQLIYSFNSYFGQFFAQFLYKISQEQFYNLVFNWVKNLPHNLSKEQKYFVRDVLTWPKWMPIADFLKKLAAYDANKLAIFASPEAPTGWENMVGVILYGMIKANPALLSTLVPELQELVNIQNKLQGNLPNESNKIDMTGVKS